MVAETVLEKNLDQVINHWLVNRMGKTLTTGDRVVLEHSLLYALNSLCWDRKIREGFSLEVVNFTGYRLTSAALVLTDCHGREHSMPVDYYLSKCTVLRRATGRQFTRSVLYCEVTYNEMFVDLPHKIGITVKV